MNKILEKARAIEQEIIADRRCLHQMPEVGVYTPRTAAYIKERLTEMGIAHRDCGVHSQEDREKMVFAGYPDAPTSTGVVAVIGKGGPCILLRADMDGLPMEETTGLDFAAKGDTAHMCGHDAHAAMLLGAARILKEMEDELPGTVKLMFQPGEEMGYGSRTMVEDGLLENPRVDAAMALHVGSQVEVGKLNYSPGVASGAMATFIISIQGKGGHSSEPQKTVDPVNIATQVCSEHAHSQGGGPRGLRHHDRGRTQRGPRLQHHPGYGGDHGVLPYSQPGSLRPPACAYPRDSGSLCQRLARRLYHPGAQNPQYGVRRRLL